LTSLAATRSRPVLDRPTRQLLEAVEDDPLAPLHVCVVAPGGHGKSLILGELAELYRRAGVEVLGPPQLPMPDGRGDHGAVIVVDDAHRLDEAQLRALLKARPLRLAVACRPWPRPAGLAELFELPGRPVSVLTPGPFDRDQVAAFLAGRWGAPPAAGVVDFVHAQTGGVPRFVDRLASALATTLAAGPATGPAARASREAQDAHVPHAALLRFRFELEQAGEDVQRFLLAADAGAGMHTELLAELFGRDTDALGELRAAARATGLLGPDGAPLPITRRAIAALVPVERRVGVRQRLAEIQLARGGPVLPLARSLLGTGVVGDRMAAVFRAGAAEALADAPELAARLFAAAVAAGSPAGVVAADWAEAAARSGDLDAALRLADQVLASPDTANPAGRAKGATVAAAALAHRGQLARSAELYRWAGGGSALAFATVALIGAGHLDRAASVPAAPLADGPPTLLDGAASLLAHGVRQSVTESAAEALPTLVRAATMLEPTGRTALLPDSPAALAALVALHCGELGIAESVLARAASAGMGGAALGARHRLLRAWIGMLHGNPVDLEHLLEQRVGQRLEPRDRLFAVALQVGLARRASDLPALHRAWEHASEAVMRHPVDLFTLLPLGELDVAAARLRDRARIAPHLAAARSLLAALGDPPLWSAPLRWSGLHAAITGEEPDLAAEHAAALAGFAGHSDYCAVLAEAAQCWLAVVAGTVDPPAVEAAARRLHGVGLCWDGARLAGQAAIRTADRKAMLQLLDCARQLQGRPARPPRPADGTEANGSEVESAPASALSDREQEVADLVLSGLTYKQIGDRLFISAKTVEHHVARMRQKLGCASRGELLARLRSQAQARSIPNA
jgi:DNA-binding CsgD family transcriptional regulator